MKQIRYGVFETNSSSTHSLCIVTEEEFQRFKNGELLFDKLEERLIGEDEAAMVPESDRQWYELDDWMTYDEFLHRNDLDWYIRPFTTPSGDEMVAFGDYGYEG